MRLPTITLFALAMADGICAQQISVSLVAPNPLVMSATTATGTSSWQLPAGTLPSFGNYPPAPGANGRPGWLAWSTEAASTIARFYIYQAIELEPGAVAARVGANELLFLVSATSPAAATVRLDWQAQASPGVLLPLVTVDVGDDGGVDFTQAGGGLQHDVVIGASPLRIRVVLDNQVTVPGECSSALVVDVRPRNDVAIQKSVLGCTGVAPDLFCEPTFVASGVEFARWVAFGLPAVVVLGLSVQPVLLPISTPVAPCLLLPNADAVVTLLGNTHTVMLPPAVRPITFWGQGVAIDGQGNLFVTDGYRIVAQ